MTLIEVLVVLVIVGVLASTVALNVGALDRGGARLEHEADLLATRLTRAAEEVLISGQAAALIWDADSYRFVTVQDGAWVPHPVPILGEVQKIAAGLTLSRDGLTSGGYLLRPDMLPEAAGSLALNLAGGGTGTKVIFDGLSARQVAGG